MAEDRLRIAGALVGDIVHEPGARTKYAFFFEALARQYCLIEVENAALQGFERWFNILTSFHPNAQIWRERFYKRPLGFEMQSRRVASRLMSMRDQVDSVIQVGVLFDARWNDLPLPNVIYTDYTARLSAQRPTAGRSPLTATELEAWLTLERRAYERAAHICTRSQLVRESIVTDYGIPSERVTKIGGGVNFARLPAIRKEAAQTDPTVLFIGKQFHRKGGDILLQAFARVRASIPRARLLFLTGDVIPSELALVGVELIKPTWNRATIESIFRRADLLVLPSRLETWGDVLLEAMAFGLPCIGVTGQAMQEIIEDGTTGLLVPPEDPEALASALTRLLQDEELRQRCGQAARQKIESGFTWDKVVERLRPILESSAQSRQ